MEIPRLDAKPCNWAYMVSVKRMLNNRSNGSRDFLGLVVSRVVVILVSPWCWGLLVFLGARSLFFFEYFLCLLHLCYLSMIFSISTVLSLVSGKGVTRHRRCSVRLEGLI